MICERLFFSLRCGGHFLDLFPKYIFISPTHLIMHCIFVLNIVQLWHNSTSLISRAVCEKTFYTRFTHLLRLQYCAFTYKSASDPCLFTTKTCIHYLGFKSKDCYLQVHLKKIENHEKGQYFLSLISESETRVLYRFITYSEIFQAFMF